MKMEQEKRSLVSQQILKEANKAPTQSQEIKTLRF